MYDVYIYVYKYISAHVYSYIHLHAVHTHMYAQSLCIYDMFQYACMHISHIYRGILQISRAHSTHITDSNVHMNDMHKDVCIHIKKIKCAKRYIPNRVHSAYSTVSNKYVYRRHKRYVYIYKYQMYRGILHIRGDRYLFRGDRCFERYTCIKYIKRYVCMYRYLIC